MRKSFVAPALLALAVAGSTLMGGWALADTGGAGTGGSATNNCIPIGVNVLAGIGVAGHGSAAGGSCDASANGTGGSAH